MLILLSQIISYLVEYFVSEQGKKKRADKAFEQYSSGVQSADHRKEYDRQLKILGGEYGSNQDR